MATRGCYRLTGRTLSRRCCEERSRNRPCTCLILAESGGHKEGSCLWHWAGHSKQAGHSHPGGRRDIHARGITMLCQVLGRKSEGCRGARCREVRSSLSGGKEAERALLDSPKMACPAGECRTFLPVLRRRASYRLGQEGGASMVEPRVL